MILIDKKKQARRLNSSWKLVYRGCNRKLYKRKDLSHIQLNKKKTIFTQMYTKK